LNLKKLIYTFLPAFVKSAIRARYYLKKFNGVSINSEKDLLLLPEVVKSGNVVLDIGANFGLYTKILAELVGANGRVYSFEPVPDTFDVLANNVRRSGLHQVTAMPLAISNTSGVATISIPKYEDGSENYYEASLVTSKNSVGIAIQTLRLDDRIDLFQRLDFVKMDVEGHEPPALEGMRAIVEQFYPIFLIEINDGFAPGSTGNLVRNMMAEWGYSMHYYDGSALRLSAGKEDGVNYVFKKGN